jgi:NAD(P)H dehydrogenase (quinone)
MKILVILGHPRPGSFNHAIAETAIRTLEESGHTVCFHDLYEERFDPVLPYAEIRADGRPEPLVATHCQDLAGAGGLVIVHPNWWGGPPAILKGWVDRVMRAGLAYELSAEGLPTGLLKASTALVLNTSDTPAEREAEVFGDPLETVWKNCILAYCGIGRIARRNYGVVVTSTPAERARWLADVRSLVQDMFPQTRSRTREAVC